MIRIGALVLKGFRLATTYRLNFLGRQMVWFFVVVWVYFMGEVFGRGQETRNVLGTDFFTYTLVGICFQQFLLTGLMSFANNLREEMLMGTLEPLLATPAGDHTVLLSGSIWNFMEASWTALVMLGLGYAFGADFAPNVPGVVLVIVLSLAALAAWGIVSASFVMVFKKADPIGWGMYAVSYLLCGVYFPVERLPVWLQPLCYLHPLTYSVWGVRDALIHGHSLWAMRLTLAALAGYAAVLIPLSLVCFRLGVRRARSTGSLVHY